MINKIVCAETRNGKTYTLQEGDSLYIDSSKPHRWKNAGEKKMVVLAALIPSKS